MPTLNDVLFDVLANEHRRQILFVLLERPASDLPLYFDTPPDGAGGNPATNIERQHIHLPKLDAHEFIEWDRDRNAVEPGPRLEEYRPVLELLADHRSESLRPDREL